MVESSFQAATIKVSAGGRAPSLNSGRRQIPLRGHNICHIPDVEDMTTSGRALQKGLGTGWWCGWIVRLARLPPHVMLKHLADAEYLLHSLY